MRKIQAQGIHHITLTGADRQTSIDFWEGLLGFSLVILVLFYGLPGNFGFSY